MTPQTQELFGIKQLAPVWGCSERHAKRLIKERGIDLSGFRLSEKGRIRIPYEKALELKPKAGPRCPSLAPLDL